MGILDKNLVTPRAVALDAYATYCDAIGVEPERNSEFTQQMQNLKPKVKDGWTRIGGKKERAWIGFGLKSVDELDLEQLPQLEQQNTLTEFTEDNSKNLKNKIGVPSAPISLR